jgi:membrane protein YdbS with pleckstrin-like domain
MTSTPIKYQCPHCGHTVDVAISDDSQLVTCPEPYCQKVFKVEVPTAKPSPDLIVPDDPKEVVSTAKVNPNGNGVVTTAKPETEIAHAELHLFRRYPLRCLVYLLILVVAVSITIPLALNGWRVLALIGLGFIGLVLFRFVRWWLHFRSTKFTVTDQRCILETGYMDRSMTDIPIKDLTDVRVEQTTFAKWFNVGDLVLQRETGNVRRMVLMAVDNPQRLAAIIQEQSKREPEPHPSHD